CTSALITKPHVSVAAPERPEYVAFTVAVPAPRPSTTPVALTTQTPGSDDSHAACSVTSRMPSAACDAARSCTLLPIGTFAGAPTMLTSRTSGAVGITGVGVGCVVGCVGG